MFDRTHVTRRLSLSLSHSATRKSASRNDLWTLTNEVRNEFNHTANINFD